MIKPMLASPSTGAGGRRAVELSTLVASGQYAFDLKLDGLRAVLYWDGSTVKILNRSLVDITAQFPELVTAAHLLGERPLVLDGEIVADDGTFTSVATRGKTVRAADVAKRAVSLPCKFIAFDLLGLDDNDLCSTPWSMRRQALEVLGGGFPERFQISMCSDDGATMWKAVSELGLEGLIAKRKNAIYVPGSRSPGWLKFKTVRQITCVAVGYEAGTGSRTRFGALQIALIGPDGPVSVGRVGTGFNEAEITDLKKRLDAGEMFLVEIEALNRTAAGVLRFPVYKGVRTDLPLTDATLSQLDQLPLC